MKHVLIRKHLNEKKTKKKGTFVIFEIHCNFLSDHYLTLFDIFVLKTKDKAICFFICQTIWEVFHFLFYFGIPKRIYSTEDAVAFCILEGIIFKADILAVIKNEIKRNVSFFDYEFLTNELGNDKIK